MVNNVPLCCRRREQGRLHVLESDVAGRTVHVVKEYVRAGAGQQVPDLQHLRPPDVLTSTLHYLLSKSVLCFRAIAGHLQEAIMHT